MSNLDDLDLGRPEDTERVEPPRRSGPPLLAGLVVVALIAAAAVGVWYARRGSEPAGAAAPLTPEAPADVSAASRPLGGAPEDVEVPPLGETDTLVRLLIGRLSTHPAVAAWLESDGLIRRATASVQNVAAGRTPVSHFRVLAPSQPFTVRQDGTRTYIDARSFARYDRIAEGFASLDPQGLARIYATVKPRAEEAYGELGEAGSVDAAVERAIVSLLEVPVPPSQVPVVPKGAGWAYADPRLERLTAAQKQLLRMGPQNVRVVQDQLRRVAAALGIPADRLPVSAT